MEKISSLQNPKIKNLIKLRKARERRKQDLIVIEGRHEIFMAQKGGLRIKELFLCPELPSDKNFMIKTQDVLVNEVDKMVFEKISIRENADGFLALAQPRYAVLEELVLPAAPLVVVLDKIEKPGNLGAMFRTADGAGADAVIVCEPHTDIFNLNIIRSSLGTVFSPKVFVSSTKNCQAWLKEHKITTIAATPRAKQEYFEIDYKKPTAIIIGTEHEGLGPEWLGLVEQKVRIPMNGQIDSLNASVSAGILVYEAVRQRQVA